MVTSNDLLLEWVRWHANVDHLNTDAHAVEGFRLWLKTIQHLGIAKTSDAWNFIQRS